MEVDINLYDKCSRENTDKLKAKEAERELAITTWAALSAQALKAGVPAHLIV
jgi:hypothetical protein